MNNHISHLESKAISSYRGTSFSPERRGKDFIAGYNQELEEDIQFLKEKQVSSSSIDWYKSKYIGFIESLIHSRSQVMSPMITGPARFPVERNRKRMQAEISNHDRFVDWRSRALRILPKRAQPRKTHDSELERYTTQLAEMVRAQECMKKINSLYPKWLKRKEGVTDQEFQAKYELSDYEIKIISEHQPAYNTRTKVFPSFRLTNNNANIKRVQSRILQVSAKKQKAELPQEKHRFEFDGGHVQLDYEFDRVKISHVNKPDEAVIQNLKSNGFHWSRNLACWMRKISRSAVFECNRITGTSIPV